MKRVASLSIITITIIIAVAVIIFAVLFARKTKSSDNSAKFLDNSRYKRPVPTEFTKSNRLDDLIYYDMPEDAEKAFSKLPQGYIILNDKSMFNPTKTQGVPQYGTFEKVQVEGMPFTEALRANCTEAPVNAYSFKIEMNLSKKFSVGDVVLVTYYMRRISGGLNDTGMGSVLVGIALNDNSHTELRVPGEAGDEWVRVYGSVKITQKAANKDCKIVIQPSYAEQVVEIGGLQVISYGKSIKLEDMPESAAYEGMEPDAQWRKDALARIEQIRKGDINIIVKDKKGNPVTNADVRIDMTEHEFEFGVAISTALLPEHTNRTLDETKKYQENLIKYFNSVVLESHHKWKYYEENPKIANDLVDWCLENGIRHVRGHTLVWDTGTPHPDVEAAINDRKALDNVIKTKIFNVAGDFKGRVQEWDVTNELLRDNRFILNRYDKEIILDWYKWAKEAAPDAKQYMNENRISGSELKRTRDRVIPFIDSLIELGLKFDGIGLQGHMTRQSSPQTFYEEIELFAKYGKELKVTEFDFLEPDKNYQANLTRDMMIIMFSHEAIKGFYAWGMWDGSAAQDRLLFTKDWRLKSCGIVYEDLVYNKWWTRESGKTGEDGMYSTRGFYGEYDITVSKDGITKTVGAAFLKGKGNTVAITLE